MKPSVKFENVGTRTLANLLNPGLELLCQISPYQPHFTPYSVARSFTLHRWIHPYSVPCAIESCPPCRIALLHNQLFFFWIGRLFTRSFTLRHIRDPAHVASCKRRLRRWPRRLRSPRRGTTTALFPCSVQEHLRAQVRSTPPRFRKPLCPWRQRNDVLRDGECDEPLWR